MKNKIITLLTALSMMSAVSAGFATVASAANVGDNEIAVSAVKQSLKLVYNKDLSSGTAKYVDVYVDNFAETENIIFAAEISFAYDSDTVKSVSLVDSRELIAPPGCGPIKWSLYSADVDVSTDKRIARFMFTTGEDVSFDVTLSRALVSVYDETNDVETTDIVTENVQTLTVPKYATEPAKPVVTTNSKQRYEENAGDPAEYWSVNVNANGTAFNTITVQAKDVNGKMTDPVTKSAGTTVSGNADISLFISIAKATSAVESVEVTTSTVAVQ